MNNNENHPEGTNPEKGFKWNKKTTIIVAIVAVLLVAVAALVFLLPKEEPPKPSETEETTTEPEVTEGPTEPVMLEHMAELYAQNPDIVGWIRIDGTKLDYPVMYTPDDEEKYIHADFEGNVDFAGLPFIDKDCTMDPESQNLIIYGHNMKNGTAFKTLFSYIEEEFWEENPTIYFSTLYEERTYEVLSVFYDRVYQKTDTCFKFYQFIDPETEEEFDEAMTYYQEHALYDTGVTAEYGDSLITLVTCSYHTRRGRLVVVAREVTEPQETVEIVS